MQPPAAVALRSTAHGRSATLRFRILFSTLLLRVTPVAFCLAASSPWAATLTEHMDLACRQPEPADLHCTFRLRDDDTLESGVAEFEGTVVAGRVVRLYPQPDDTTAVMLVVDTSDPARHAVIEKTVDHIEDLLAVARAHHRFALTSFDADLVVRAPLGSTVDEIRAGTRLLAAKGQTTELYRSVREAVRLLAQDPATRKVLVLMSDGLAEDFAYHHQDVVAAARAAQVVIHTIGFPRSVAHSVALQTLRRLADETGGLYAQANLVDNTLPGGLFERLLAAADSGGEIAFDLTALIAAGAHGPVDVSLAFQTGEESFTVLAPVVLPDGLTVSAVPDTGEPSSAAARIALPGSAPPPAPSASARPAAPLVDPGTRDAPWLALFMALLAIALVTLGTVIVQRRQRASTVLPGAATTRPLAYIVLADRTGDTRYPLDKTPWRIGRGQNNDLVLTDHSVSRLHAEIRANDAGQLVLADLESLNGVFVNDERIASSELREGDTIDIGDVRMSFTRQDETYADQDATVIVRTRTP